MTNHHPIEASGVTEAMLAAGLEVAGEGNMGLIEEELTAIYLAMQSASPPPVTASAEEVASPSAVERARRNVYLLQGSGDRLCEALREIEHAESVEIARVIAKKALAHKEPEPNWSAISSLGREKVSEGVEGFDRLLKAKSRRNMPLGNGERLVGFVLSEEDAGLSEGVFALEALVNAALSRETDK